MASQQSEENILPGDLSCNCLPHVLEKATVWNHSGSSIRKGVTFYDGRTPGGSKNISLGYGDEMTIKVSSIAED